MLDRHILPVQKFLLHPAARLLRAARISADQITLAGFAAGLASVPMLASGHFRIALWFILANRLLDGLDGAVARLDGPTDRGAFIDIALDFVFYAIVPLGFAIADPSHNALAAASLIAAFIGTGTSFLAFAIVAAQRQMKAEYYLNKGIYYLGGLTEGAETIALFIVMCLWPSWFAPLAYGYAFLCVITTLMRWHQGWTTFRDK